MKELGRLEGQLAGLRQELAALTLKQDSVADQVGLLPQQLQAVRDDVSWDPPDLLLDTCPLGPSVLGQRASCLGSLLVPQAPRPALAQMLASFDGSTSCFALNNVEGCS